MADEVDIGNINTFAMIDAARSMNAKTNAQGRCKNFIPGQVTGPKIPTETQAQYLARLGDEFCAQESCGEEIPIERREHCYSLCVDCQTKLERKRSGL